MSFLNPTYLWGLLALLVPLVIHFLNKGDVKTIKVGSVKYLEAQETTQTKKLKLNEYVLLFLRMLLLGLLVLAISVPSIEKAVKKESLTYFIEPSLLGNDKMKSLLESESQASFRFFSTDFPTLDTDKMPNGKPNYWQLAEALNDFPSDSIVVFSESRVSGIRGIRPKIPNTINWVVMNQGTKLDTLIGAYKTDEEVVLVNVVSSDGYTDIEKESISRESNIFMALLGDSIKVERNGKTSKVRLWTKDTLAIGLFYDSDFSREVQYILAALDAVSVYAQQPLHIKKFKDDDSMLEADFDFLIWLKSKPVSETDTNYLSFQPDSLSGQLISKGYSNNSFFLTERLSIRNTLKGRLPERLLEIIAPKEALTERIAPFDKRVLASEELVPLPTNSVQGAIRVNKTSLASWVWFIAIVVLVVERVLSKLRRQ
ncbi:BatA domain-containing protein [Maribacter sp. R77961]|uniref:BatA domain-containing protein n=1 Tax=Maribacter sp. R77961 TaxID=3093871 RepID=UPI0037CA9B12